MESNLTLLHIFAVVAESGNISAAAKKLFISQPAISKSIRHLEDDMGTKLFERNSRGVSLTDEGQILYRHVSEAIRTIENGKAELERYRSLGLGHLSIGVSTTLCRHRLLPYLDCFTKCYPHISINISCQSSNQTLALLEKGSIDIGLVAKPANNGNLHYLSLGSIEDIFVATPNYLDHLEMRQQTHGMDMLNKGTLILLDKENVSREYVDYFLEENHIHPTNLISITTMDLLIEFARTSLGIACVIKEFVQDDLDRGNLIEIPLSSSIHHREIGFVWNETGDVNPSLQTFVKLVSKELEEKSCHNM